MNLWRYLGISVFFVAAVCLSGTADLSGSAGDKKTTPTDKTTEAPKKTEPAKTTVAPKTTEPPKKTEEPKKEVVVQPPAKAGDAMELKAFISKDATFFQEQVTTTEQKIKVTNQEVIQKQKQTFIIQWTALGKDDKDGNYKVEQKIVGVEMEIDIGGNKITYDSRLANPKNPMTEFFTKLTESKLVFHINIDKDKGFKVIEVKGRKEFIDGLSDINPQMKALLNAILSENALKSMAEPSWWAFPSGGTLAKDQKWDRESKLDLGPIGTYATKFDFAYKGPEGKDMEKIDIKTSLTYAAPGASEKVGLPFIIQEAKLSSESGDGYAIFDRVKGRFQKTEINMKLSGKLKIEVGNMTTEVELNQTQKAVSTAHDANPWAAAATPKKEKN